MPTKKDGGKEAPPASGRETRRTSLGRPQPKDHSPGNRLPKIKLSIESDQSKKGRSITGAAMPAPVPASGAVEEPKSQESLLRDMHNMMQGLTSELSLIHI